MGSHRNFYDQPFIGHGRSFFDGINVYGGVHFKFSLSGYRQILFDTNLFDEIEFNPAYLIIIARSFMLALAATFYHF